MLAEYIIACIRQRWLARTLFVSFALFVSVFEADEIQCRHFVLLLRLRTRQFTFFLRSLGSESYQDEFWCAWRRLGQL